MKNCYKVMVRIRTAGEPLAEEKIYEILADNPAEAEDLVIARHAKDWIHEEGRSFDGVRAVFPCDR